MPNTTKLVFNPLSGEFDTVVDVVGLDKLAVGALPAAVTIASANIVNDSIMDADINSAAAIAGTKLANTPAGNLGATTVQAALDELQSDVDTRATDASLTSHTNSTAAHGATGEVVGTTNTQALTNKTIDADVNTISNIEDVDIKAGAAIARSKLAGGNNDHVVINSGTGVLTSEATLAIARGGTNLSALGTALQVLRVNAGATALEFVTAAGSGDVLAGGNTLGAALTLGTNDDFGMNFETNATTRGSVSADGLWNFNRGVAVNSRGLIVSNTAVTSTLSVRAVATWATRTSASDTNWQSVCWSPEVGLFVAVADAAPSTRIMTSPDGITWTSRTHPGASGLRSVCWSPGVGLFVIVARNSDGDGVITSPDGINWTNRNPASSAEWESVCWSPELGLFVAVAVYSDSANVRAMTSPDGINWTIRTTPAENEWASVCWSPEVGLFVAVSSDGTGDRVMTSPDGTTWTSRAPADNNWSSVCWSSERGLFVAVSANSSTPIEAVMTSTNGIDWTVRNAAVVKTWQSVCWSPELGLFTAVGSGTNNLVMTSPDGTTWTSRTTPANNAWNSICWSPELGIHAVAANTGTGNRVMTSLDVGVYAPRKLVPKYFSISVTNITMAGVGNGMFYEAGSWTSTLSGCTTSPTTTIHYIRTGKQVLLTSSGVEATSNTVAATLSGLPTALRPPSTVNSPTRITENSASVIALLEITAGGTIQLYPQAGGGNFTASGQKGVSAFQVTYRIA